MDGLSSLTAIVTEVYGHRDMNSLAGVSLAMGWLTRRQRSASVKQESQ